MLILIAIVSMISALVLYTSGVWGEKLAGILQTRHLICFWSGFLFDTLGTTIMAYMAGGFVMNLHGITGLLAIVLVFLNVVWATLALWVKNDKILLNFHRFSLMVWVIWLVPFASGMLMSMVH